MLTLSNWVDVKEGNAKADILSQNFTSVHNLDRGQQRATGHTFDTTRIIQVKVTAEDTRDTGSDKPKQMRRNKRNPTSYHKIVSHFTEWTSMKSLPGFHGPELNAIELEGCSYDRYLQVTSVQNRQKTIDALTSSVSFAVVIKDLMKYLLLCKAQQGFPKGRSCLSNPRRLLDWATARLD